MKLSRQLWILWSVLLLSSCASIQPRFQEIQVPPERISQKGFSLVPLNEKGWLWPTVGRDPYRLTLGKQGDHPDETFAIEADVGRFPEFKSNEEFLRLVKEGEAAKPNPSRFKLLKHDVNSYTGKGTDCARLHTVAEDHGAVKRTERTGHMVLERLSLICVHPKDKRAGVKVTYSQRYYPSDRDPQFLEKAASVMNSVEFTDL